MASHDVARLTKAQIEERRRTDVDKIHRYRGLEDDFRKRVADGCFDTDTFQLCTKLLRQNPEYYSVWNARRRCLISGLLSKPSAGSSRSTALPSSSASATPTCSSGVSSASSSTATRPPPDPPTAGRNGTTVDDGANEQPSPAEAPLPIADADADAGTAPEPSDAAAKSAARDLETLRSELMFTIPLLMEYPKCYWIWKYRLWILHQAIERFDVMTARSIWEEELGLVGKMLTRDKRNFHAWNYRRLVVSQLEGGQLLGRSLVEPEFDYTRRMIEGDLSNFSAWHHRSQLIPRLLDERAADDAARKQFLDRELAMAREALNVGPDDQSLWLYHQCLVLGIAQPSAPLAIAPNLTAAQRKAYIDDEIAVIEEFLEDYTNIKWIYEALIEYTLAGSRLHGAGTTGLAAEERSSVAAWLDTLKTLDAKRIGRWAELEKRLEVA